MWQVGFDSNQSEWQIKRHNQFVICFKHHVFGWKLNHFGKESIFCFNFPNFKGEFSVKNFNLSYYFYFLNCFHWFHTNVTVLESISSTIFRSNVLWKVQFSVNFSLTKRIKQLIQFACIKMGKKNFIKCTMNEREIVCVKMSLLIRQNCLKIWFNCFENEQ